MSPEYQAWMSMRSRCSARSKNRPYYFDRGIRVCKRWDDFTLFLKDVGPRPSPHHSLDRKNNNRGYTPRNCRWATRLEQMRNVRTNVRFEGKCLAEWAEIIGMDRKTLTARVARGWTLERAVKSPIFYGGDRCRRGHLYTSNVKMNGGKRACRTCINTSARARRS